MACLYRPSYTRKDPRTGKKVKRKLKKWYGQYRDAKNKLQCVPLSPNKQAAQQMLANLLRDVELEKAGLLDRNAVANRFRPLMEHFADWEAELLTGDAAPEGVRLKVGRARRLIEDCGFNTAADISANEVVRWLARFRDKGRDIACGKGSIKGKKIAVRTSNFYLAAVKSFCEWLVDEERAVKNPLRRLQGGNAELDRRHVRRELRDDELSRLFRTTASRRAYGGLSGADRMLLYVTAAYTGLRAKELNQLDSENFDLKDGYLILRPEQVKNRDGITLPLHRGLIEQLAPFVGKARPGEKLWPGTWAKNRRAGKILSRDLSAAGIAHRTAAGVADFHALRVTFITKLVRAGVLPKVAQFLARHSTVSLTLDKYTRLGLVDIRSGLDALPPIGNALKDGLIREAS